MGAESVSDSQDRLRLRIEEQRTREFDNPKREWRRVFAEAWGTFLLVLVSAGAHIAVGSGNSSVSRGLAEMAPGLAVMAIIYGIGSISGAHVNPAVTLAFALRRNFPWRRLPAYWAAQSAGGVAAILFLKTIAGASGALGATVPQEGFRGWQVIALEAVITAGLVTIVLGTAAGARNIGKLGGIAIGGYIAATGLWAAAFTGASMNPARSLGPDIVRGDFSTSHFYVLGPLAGAVIGAAFEWALKGSPTTQGTKEAQGDDDSSD